ncbi:MAG TPA: hypothetical protein VLU73_02840 [Methylococcaceae bacterium]|nr:hypothetical protein [Methylococcaceae bacterium]
MILCPQLERVETGERWHERLADRFERLKRPPAGAARIDDAGLIDDRQARYRGWDRAWGYRWLER